MRMKNGPSDTKYGPYLVPFGRRLLSYSNVMRNMDIPAGVAVWLLVGHLINRCSVHAETKGVSFPHRVQAGPPCYLVDTRGLFRGGKGGPSLKLTTPSSEEIKY
jgi:hypothetical protein